MIRNRRIKTQTKTLTFILIVLLSSMFMIFPMNNSDSETNFNEVDNILPEPIKIIESPRPSKISSAPWWDGSWRFRRLINVTNPNTNLAFTNYTTSVVFNYTVHTVGTPAYPMNGDLSDIRIVQDGELRKYYYKKNYPETDFVTVWFDVDIDKSPNHIDTDNIFLYFNGSTQETVDPNYFMDESKESNNTKDALGWIRNGDFELDDEPGQKLTTEVFGWTYTNAAPSFYDVDGEDEKNVDYMHELTESNDNQERAFGNWSFKWGDLGSWILSVDDPKDPPNVGYDFEGTLYTYPFIVPTVEGSGVDLELEVYRNFRVYNTKDAHPMGFYIRLCEDYSSNVDGHREVLLEENYIANEGNPGASETTVLDPLSPTTLYDTRNDAGPTPYTADGEVTGKISIDLDASLMGRLLFLEVGTYGKEFNTQTAFTQVDNATFNYKLNTALNDDVQEVAGEATFITKDVDGRIVPNAEVTIMEEYGTPTTIGPYETSEEDGSVSFSNVAYGNYNVSVNYTIPYSGLEEVVYDSRTIPTEFLIDGSGQVYELTLNMSTIDFEIVDYGGYPLTYGYINISYDEGGTALDILELNNDGKATFRWLNRSYYYYQVYYNNIDYSPNPTPLNASYIWRDNYAKYPDGDKHQFNTLNINENNQAPPSSQYNVKERIYMNDSMTQISDLKLLNVSISIQNNEFLTNVSVYYIDSSDTTDTLSHRIFFDDSYVGETNDIITIDLMTVVNSQLSSEKRLAYGLLIDVWGINSSICTGDIEINTTEAWHVFNKTAISKLNIRVLGDGATISDAIVTIKSNETILGNIVSTTLISDKDRDSFAFSDNELPFIFLRGYYYNFSIRWEGATIRDTFNVSGPDPDQWAPNTHVNWYNYSLLKYNFTLEFDLDMGSIEPGEYKLKFDNLTNPESVVWGDNVLIQVFFNKTEDNWVLTDSAVIAPDSIQLKLQLGTEVLFTFNLDPTGTPGYYEKGFNSSILSAGIAGVYYKLVITGTKSPYILQGDEIETLYVKGKGTVLSIHDYKNNLNATTAISQHYDEFVNISARYYNDSNSPITGATISYEWLGLAPIQFYEDPINPGYYTFTIDTSDAQSTGLKIIIVSALFENFTSQSILVYLTVLERETTINGQELVYLNPKVNVTDAQDFVFNYTDANTYETLGDLTVATYVWQELYENGTVISGRDGSGTLIQNIDNTYTLDFNTELKRVGFYFLYVTLKKENYEPKSALINLGIILREFTVDVDVENLAGNQVNVVQGNEVNLKITLIDLTRGNIPLENVSVNLSIGGHEYEFNETSPGIYSLDFETEEIEAFFAPNLLAGIIYINIENFTSQQVRININVQMEEIFPGMSAFYFILIMASIIGIAGSLITYRVVQQARIPKFVKKVRKVKGSIKSKKVITESHITRTKDQMMVKLYGDDWRELQLSLEDTLGIVDSKLKPTPLKTKKGKKGGGR